MKFKIRYADQLVGIFTIVAMVGLVALAFAIGANKNWFSKRMNFYTMFDSASGISTGMDLTYKGFAIGKIKSVSLEGHRVRADFYILGDYEDYVKEGSLVQLITSPIGLGSEFVLHPGLGAELIPDGSELFRTNSPEGQKIIATNLNHIEDQSDSIGLLLNKVSTLLDNVNLLLQQLNNGFEGKGDGQLTKIIANASGILKNLNSLTGGDSSNEGLVAALLGTDLLNQLNGILENLNGLSGSADDLLYSANPEIQSLLNQLDSTLLNVNDVLEGVKNNPLIKSGVPDRSNPYTSTSFSRSSEF